MESKEERENEDVPQAYIAMRSLDDCINEHYSEATEYDKEKLRAFAADWAEERMKGFVGNSIDPAVLDVFRLVTSAKFLIKDENLDATEPVTKFIQFVKSEDGREFEMTLSVSPKQQ